MKIYAPGFAGLAAAIHMRQAADLMVATDIGPKRTACLMYDRDRWSVEQEAAVFMASNPLAFLSLGRRPRRMR